MKSPFTLLAGIVLILGGLALGGTAVVQFVKPPRFETEAKIRVIQPGSSGGYDALFMKAQVEAIQSPAVLTNVITELALNDVWGKKYNGGQRLSDLDVQQILKLDCQLVRNSEIIEIKVGSDDPTEATLLANAIVKSYREYGMQSKSASVDLLMAPTPSRVVSPNRPLAIMIIVTGVLMAIGGVVCLKEGMSDSGS